MPRRLCFVSPHVYGYFNPEHGHTGGGAERQIYLLSTTLADQFDIHVIVGDYGQPKKEQRHGVTLHRAYPLHTRKNPLQPVKHFLILAAAMHRADADIYIHRGSPRNAAIVYVITRLLRKIWVYNLANDANIVDRPSSLSTPIRWLFTRAIQNADSLIAQTETQRKMLQDAYGRDATVVPNGYSKADNTPNFDDRDAFLWVGSLDPDQKRPGLFLDLASKLPEQDFRLVGPIDETKNSHKELLARAQSLDNLTMVGALPPSEIHSEYRKAIALVSTSAYEGFPNTFLEAWRQGTPVISLDVDPKRYIPFKNVDGYADGDIQTLTTLCRKLSTDPEMWQSWGDESRTLFESNLSIESVVEQYGNVLKDLF